MALFLTPKDRHTSKNPMKQPSKTNSQPSQLHTKYKIHDTTHTLTQSGNYYPHKFHNTHAFYSNLSIFSDWDSLLLEKEEENRQSNNRLLGSQAN
jgi:hypothetical protein